MIRYISLFSGIECATLAAKPLGWEPICFSEIESFPSAVLAHHYPDIPNVGDVTKHDWARYRGKCDVVIGGSPCQAFSVAGRRKSLTDDRGNLTLSFVEAVNAIDPTVVVWENVPGVLSTKDNAFGCFLGAMVGEPAALVPVGKWTNAGLAVGPRRSAAWRVLDAQYFGVAQRRRRVFLVGCSRASGLDPAEILFELESLRRDTPPRRGEKEDAAGTIEASAGRSRGAGTSPGVITPIVAGTLNSNRKAAGSATQQDASQGLLIPQVFGGNNTSGPIEVLPTIRAHASPQFDFDSDAFIAHTLRGDGFDASEDGTGRGTPLVAFSCKDHGDDAGTISPTLRSMTHDKTRANAGGQVAVALALRGRGGSGTAEIGDDIANALQSSEGGGNKAHILADAVRRLTPRECERLQGLDDDYTRIPWRGRPADECPDGPRYKGIGNSMAKPCIGWVLARVDIGFKASGKGCECLPH